VLPHCSDEVAAGGLLFICDQQAVLPHPSDLALDQREQVRDRVHPMKFKALGGLHLGPVDTDKDDVGGGPDQRFEKLTGRSLAAATDRIEFWLALRARELVA
jgi:hypothetical protein